jgi:hypothetical protein
MLNSIDRISHTREEIHTHPRIENSYKSPPDNQTAHDTALQALYDEEDKSVSLYPHLFLLSGLLRQLTSLGLVSVRGVCLTMRVRRVLTGAVDWVRRDVVPACVRRTLWHFYLVLSLLALRRLSTKVACYNDDPRGDSAVHGME